MLKFVHFVIDDKFIPDSIKCFENAKLVDNIFYYVTTKSDKLAFLDSNKVKVISPDLAREIIVDDNIDVICLHSLYSLPLSLIPIIGKNIKVIWYAWGFDLYSNPAPTGPLIDIGEKVMPLTKSVLEKAEWKNNILRKGKKILKKILHKDNTISYDTVLSALARIDYFSGVFENEFDMLTASQPSFRAQKVVHNYIHPQEFCIDDINEPVKLTGHNILLGNSAAYHNNHIDMMSEIKEHVDLSVKIIAPLSYQIIPSYVEKVIEYGKETFNDRFSPLEGYLPFDEYTKIMNSCDSIILGQKQQAATCNCLTALWNGLKLFLPKDSMNYQYYSKLGFIVFSVENDFQKNPSLSKEEVLHNRLLIEKIYSYRAWVCDLQDTIKLISK